jgi:hypothetical protein
MNRRDFLKGAGAVGGSLFLFNCSSIYAVEREQQEPTKIRMYKGFPLITGEEEELQRTTESLTEKLLSAGITPNETMRCGLVGTHYRSTDSGKPQLVDGKTDLVFSAKYAAAIKFLEEQGMGNDLSGYTKNMVAFNLVNGVNDRAYSVLVGAVYESGLFTPGFGNFICVQAPPPDRYKEFKPANASKVKQKLRGILGI